ncbi:histidine kinase [Heliobacterium undosum]|uniref:histidine kinase n=1 Tax=Heliomicrobium undosum TaxID=121734 RepID=A0A845L4E6_9FIRM|nr:PocR ligand-binding domain-containing protein [Heliomicrobium undosum]MZP30069.1 histidine kinase [Heliomicrobium undosum]
MERYPEYQLSEIINVAKLQEIQDKFTEATGIAAVIVDGEGRPLTNPSKFTKFCMLVRSTPEGLNRCMCSDSRGGRAAVRGQGANVYRCHGGLTDLAAPIIVNDQYMGAFLAGQVRLSERDYDVFADVQRRIADLGYDLATVDGLLAEVEEIPENRVKAAADLLYIMTNYIVEMGMANIVQRRLMTEMKEKADLEKMLREAEIKALQSQINPHFLFNTLNTIARLALLEGASQTEEVVYALSDLLRHNLRHDRPMSVLREEISYIQSYLSIQAARFGDRIRSTVNVPEDLLDIQIPTMTLQPLVENAIIHGLEQKTGGGKIDIAAVREEGRVTVTIADTGVGVTPEKIAQIFRGERYTPSGHTTGLGILNVHLRLQHYFGRECGLDITGIPGEGTTVEIHLPSPANEPLN